MKGLTEFLKESKKGWEYFKNVIDTRGISLPGLDDDEAKWLYINTQGETIAPYTEADLKQATEDLEDDFLETEVKKLKIGESYDADGGISIYVRIK